MADERGAPTDFGGAVFPNPDNVAPVLDTEIGPPQKTNANISNYRTPKVQRLPEGMLVPGNIDLNHRPTVKNADGSESTEYSTSFQDENGHEVLIPTVIGGRFFTPKGTKPPVGSDAEKKMIQAAIAYHRSDPTHPHLGVFDSAENADAYAEIAHSSKRNPNGEPMYVAPSLHPGPGPSYSRRVQYPTGQVVAFPDHLSPEEFNNATKKAWEQFKQ